ncbi:GTP-binding protein typa/bipa, putative [Theileria equi strain WA]|uniref:GTP-binding protein typa/bipa, putative n=1 Tax=Theileria equi strain WA TaxID=1537102 RepID=L1LC89_THEEQ|nr:GTP-binding protein typa/bipa, putative [Theileria equi strain WA]EKX72961.1 GTP-binding protein typa/bipa, putative [Theileria equi strain WA]|eukprot:XP_004832413.1 GTP-binding protein typa/bipa, putative [Theileria equi strain WA]
MYLYQSRILSHISKINFRSVYSSYRRFSNIRNVAVVAHVDHGKTTLVDEFLKCSGETISQTRTMDSHDLERERGITITSKVTRLNWNNNLLNIVDTPGHADFGGEVERILNIVDCICLLVDVVEGPKPQTGFVLRKALENPLMRAVVIVNKCDRECNKTKSDIENELFDLFVDSNASDDQLEFPILYASAKNSIVSTSFPLIPDQATDISYILKTLVETAPSPKLSDLDYFTFQVSLIDLEDGSILLTGKVYSGTISRGATLHVRDPLGNKRGQTIVKEIFIAKHAKRVKMTEPVRMGDIITIQCYKGVTPSVNDTVSSSTDFTPLKPVKVTDPVISVIVSANNGPLAGSDGKFLTTLDIGKRLKREALTNLALQVEESGDKTSFMLKGRGELQIGILLENMRREGYELLVSPLTAITFKNEDGFLVEAFQKLIAYVPSEFSPQIIEIMGSRNIELISYSEPEGGMEEYRTLEFHGSTTQMLGIMSVLRDITRGKGEFSVSTIDHRKVTQERYNHRQSGCLIASCSGTTTAFGLEPVMSKGTLFVSEGMSVYEGMVIGESGTDKDLYLNVIKSKPVTGMRNKGHEQTVKILCKILNVEQALAFINTDEQLELTPKRISIRKKVLSRY